MRGDNGRLPSFSQHPNHLPLEPFPTKNYINAALKTAHTLGVRQICDAATTGQSPDARAQEGMTE